MLRLIYSCFDMLLFCAAIWRDSVSFLRFPFLSHVHVFSWEMSVVCRLNRPKRCFSFYFCFVVISVLLILVSSILFLVAVISPTPLSFLCSLRVIPWLLLLLLLLLILTCVLFHLLIFCNMAKSFPSLCNWYWTKKGQGPIQICRNASLLKLYNSGFFFFIFLFATKSKNNWRKKVVHFLIILVKNENLNGYTSF